MEVIFWKAKRVIEIQTICLNICLALKRVPKIREESLIFKFFSTNFHIFKAFK